MNARAWTLFGIVSVLWGIPYLFISIAVNDGIPPAFLAWVRVVLGACILLPLAWHAGVLGSLRGRGRWLIAFGVAEIVIPFPLIAAGEQHVSSSVAAILIAATPLMVATLAIRFDHEERAVGSRLVGLFVGLAGVICLVGIDIAGNGDELLGAAAILVAGLGYAIGPMLLKHKFAGVEPLATMPGALVVASIALAPLAAADLPESSALTGEAVASLAVLGVVCTAAAFIAFGKLIATIGPGRALVITYVNPLVAVIAGIVVLGEEPGPGAIAGLLLILLGSYLATGGGLPPGGKRRGAPGAEVAPGAAKPGPA
ncbi:MAG: DMT family transporter [Solirubrobacterales bacterium]|nr:DMT family transporter [Solirubrobacterales bacterium]